jgi:hypothetical protein
LAAYLSNPRRTVCRSSQPKFNSTLTTTGTEWLFFNNNTEKLYILSGTLVRTTTSFISIIFSDPPSKSEFKMHWTTATLFALAGPATALIRFQCSQLVVERLDPLVTPGLVPSPHVHQVEYFRSFISSH